MYLFYKTSRGVSFCMIFSVRNFSVLLTFNVRRRKSLERNRTMSFLLKVLLYAMYFQTNMLCNFINRLWIRPKILIKCPDEV